MSRPPPPPPPPLPPSAAVQNDPSMSMRVLTWYDRLGRSLQLQDQGWDASHWSHSVASSCSRGTSRTSLRLHFSSTIKQPTTSSAAGPTAVLSDAPSRPSRHAGSSATIFPSGPEPHAGSGPISAASTPAVAPSSTPASTSLVFLLSPAQTPEGADASPTGFTQLSIHPSSREFRASAPPSTIQSQLLSKNCLSEGRTLFSRFVLITCLGGKSDCCDSMLRRVCCPSLCIRRFRIAFLIRLWLSICRSLGHLRGT